jgi:hypothetical protein
MGADSQYQGRRKASDALPSFVADTGAPAKGDDDVEALKRQPSDEIELYRFDP